SAGLTRDDAYRVVQRNAMKAWDERRSFRGLLEADAEIQALNGAVDFDAAFNLESSLVNIDRTFEALAAIQK
ncbi:MAG: adenylosuccinate lyase, partial [Actinomycetota bacterium]|nr:adenylosuccinate lyase [Actinomycetota bacterium]